MRAIKSLKKILTWTNMSVMVVILSTAVIPASATNVVYDESGKNIIKVAKIKKDPQEESRILRQLSCLARNVFYEANGEPMAGQMAVAQVTINRARSGLFPRDLCAVVSQSTVTSDNIKTCQFSWYCDPTKNKHKVISETHPSYIAAQRVFLEGQRVEKIDEKVYYFHRHDLEVDPNWKRKGITKIGNHVFYKR